MAVNIWLEYRQAIHAPAVENGEVNPFDPINNFQKCNIPGFKNQLSQYFLHIKHKKIQL